MMIKIIVAFICGISLFYLAFFYKEGRNGYPVITWWTALVLFMISIGYCIYLGETS